MSKNVPLCRLKSLLSHKTTSPHQLRRVALGRLFHVGLEEKRGIRGINPHSGGRRGRESAPQTPRTHVLMRLFKISSPGLSHGLRIPIIDQKKKQEKEKQEKIGRKGFQSNVWNLHQCFITATNTGPEIRQNLSNKLLFYL